MWSHPCEVGIYLLSLGILIITGIYVPVAVGISLEWYKGPVHQNIEATPNATVHSMLMNSIPDLICEVQLANISKSLLLL